MARSGAGERSGGRALCAGVGMRPAPGSAVPDSGAGPRLPALGDPAGAPLRYGEDRGGVGFAEVSAAGPGPPGPIAVSENEYGAPGSRPPITWDAARSVPAKPSIAGPRSSTFRPEGKMRSTYSPRGAPGGGTGRGVTGGEDQDGGLAPYGLRAVTVNVYAAPFVRPEIRA